MPALGDDRPPPFRTSLESFSHLQLQESARSHDAHPSAPGVGADHIPPMSHAPRRASDMRSTASSTHASPKDTARPAPPTLPPITTNAAALAHGHRASEPGRAPLGGPPSAGGHVDASSRTLTMHSILNPPSRNDGRRGSLPDTSRRPSDPATSPSTAHLAGRTLPPMSLASPYPPRVGESHEALRRAPPPSSISMPGPSKSPYASAASTPNTAARTTYGFPVPSAPPSDRRGSDSVTTAPQSLTNSPTTSYSSYIPTQRNSPANHYAQMAGPSGHAAHTAPPMGPGAAAASAAHEAAYRGSGAGPGPYPFMTMETEQGTIQVPVDVQAASRVADEKRKRNAGASARFRQRRKEKEREASVTIARLESKVREVAEEKEYYRLERDYFRDLVYNSPAGAAVAARRPSPPARTATPTAATARAAIPPEWQQAGERGGDDGRNQRRRISGHPGEPGAPSPPGAAAPAYAYARSDAPAHYAPPAPAYGAAWKAPVA